MSEEHPAPRPGSHIWKAWADGKTVQVKYRMVGPDGTEFVWIDNDPRNYASSGWHNVLGPDEAPEKWRVKPPVKNLSVRFAVCKMPLQGDNISFDIAKSEEEAKYIEEKNIFIKWVTDWINVEVEVEDD